MVESRSFTAIAVENERTLLSRLHAMLESDPVGSRDQFADLMKAAFAHCRLDARALSDDLGYNYSTVHRWIDGRTAPHPSLWPRISDWVARALKARVDASVELDIVEA